MNNKSVYILISIVVVVVVILGLYQQGLLPKAWTSLLSAEIGSSATDSGGEAQLASSSGSSSGAPQGEDEELSTLDLGDIQLILANVDAAQKQALLEDEAAFRNFVITEASNKSLLAAARSNKLHENANVRFLMERAANNVLRELYVNGIINSRVSPDFPSETQIQDYYETNRQNMVIEERISVWQVFFPVSETMTDEEVSALEAQANQVASDIRAGSIDFSTAALTHSKNEPSRLNGGYMGILKMSDLIPVIREALVSLPLDVVGDPNRSEMGYHILKRGEIIPSQDVSLQQVQGDIRTLLINQVRTNLINDVRSLATASFPVSYPDELLEEWRTTLQSAE